MISVPITADGFVPNFSLLTSFGGKGILVFPTVWHMSPMELENCSSAISFQAENIIGTVTTNCILPKAAELPIYLCWVAGPLVDE